MHGELDVVTIVSHVHFIEKPTLDILATYMFSDRYVCSSERPTGTSSPLELSHPESVKMHARHVWICEVALGPWGWSQTSVDNSIHT